VTRRAGITMMVRAAGATRDLGGKTGVRSSGWCMG
jgi:hypothetical protein